MATEASAHPPYDEDTIKSLFSSHLPDFDKLKGELSREFGLKITSNQTQYIHMTKSVFPTESPTIKRIETTYHTDYIADDTIREIIYTNINHTVKPVFEYNDEGALKCLTITYESIRDEGSDYHYKDYTLILGFGG